MLVERVVQPEGIDGRRCLVRILRNYDVVSYYPSLMIKNKYTSRNIPSPELFESVYNNRVEAKKNGDKVKANALKLILNTTYGASLAKTNPLYDPLMGRSVCISGQLYLLELAQHLYSEIPDLEIVALNTDGIFLEFEDIYEPLVKEILQEWQQRTGFELEEDRIKAVYQKDVNNYIVTFENRKVKTKGAYVTFGMATAGAFKINNDFTIVKEAVIKYFTEGIPVEDTICACDDILKFQIIAKAGGGYSSVYRVPPNYEEFKKKFEKENRFKVVDAKGKSVWKSLPWRWWCYTGPRSTLQKVNRVYASLNPNMGTLVKVKPDGTVGKIGGLPESCIIDNRNQLTLDAVDRSWYIRLAKKYIEDYTGESYDR
jgi:hypothetical protein